MCKINFKEMLIQKILNVFAVSLKTILPKMQEIPPPPPPGPPPPGTPIDESILIVLVVAVGLGFYISKKYRYTKRRA